MSAEAIRVASEEDLDPVTRTLWLAFGTDPLWHWAFPEHTPLEQFWRFLIRGALRHGWVWVLGDYAAASVWIPPRADELSAEEEAQMPGLIGELAGARAGEIMTLLERFESSHPRKQPHYYLSILGTHPSRRGEGLGMRLLAHNLSLIDRERMAAYLESSNPGNDGRYEGVGFTRAGAFSTPDGAHTVSTMWRAPAS